MKPRPVNKLTLDDMQSLAHSHKGRCISSKYMGLRRKLRWQCKAGHEWDATPMGVKKGSWCPVCHDQRRVTINDMQAMASARGGRCLSVAYVNANTKLEWECAYGHLWFARPAYIKSGTWCPQCGSH